MLFPKKYFGIFAVLLLSFWAIKPLFVQGFFPMHDDTQVARVFEMGKALKDGMFPVRWVSDLGYGYGYPIFNFYAPFSYYFGGFLTLLGFDALIATKIMMVLGIILSGVFMYLLAREFWGEAGGIVSGLFYLYAPYHAVDIFVRGDVAEYWAYAFIPLAFLGFYKLTRSNINDLLKWVIVGSFGYSGIILSHNLTAMMITPFLLVFVLILSVLSHNAKKIFTLYYLLFTIFLGLGISAFYWIPAVFEMNYTNVMSQIGGGADFRNHYVCLSQLWDSPWGFGGSTKGCIDGLSVKIGKLHIILTALSSCLFVFLQLFKKKIKHFNNIYYLSDRVRVMWFSILGLFIAIFLMLEISQFVWEAIPLMAFFQYPWRFLLLVSFFTSLLSGSLIWLASDTFIKKNKYFNTIMYSSTGFLIFTVIFLNTQHFIPQTIHARTVEYYTNIEYLRWTVSKISDEYLPYGFLKPQNPNELPDDIILPEIHNTEIQYKFKKTQEINAQVNSPKDSSININIAYFPAWKVSVDNKNVLIEILKKGFSINIPSGHHGVDIKFQETLVEKIGNVISLISVVFVIAIIIFKRTSLKKM